MSEPVMRSAEHQVRDRARAARRLARLYEAEVNGLMWATSSTQELSWSKDPDEQAAFLRGFNEGREIFRACLPAASTDREVTP